ncbi:MED6-domain-containing protein [Meredithblackwellia eburnea MCA 4105]
MATSMTNVVWRATEWLLAFGPLTSQTALDYFILSPFFDRSSNNAVLRMQMQFSRGGMEGVDEEAELKKFVGSEYAVVHATPPNLFIIHKRDRVSPTEAETISVYYILNDNVYQGPTLYSVINERVVTSLHSLQSSLSLLKENKPRWTPERLYEWDIKPPPSSTIVPLDGHEQGTSDRPLKRAREENDTSDPSKGVENGVGEDGAEEVQDDDDEVMRPPEMFNPLLFRALQTVAAELGPPREPPPPPPQGTTGATGGAKPTSGSAGAAGTTEGTSTRTGSEAPEGGAKEVNGVKKKGKKV